MSLIFNRRTALAGSLAVGGWLWPRGSHGDEASVHPKPKPSDRLPDLSLTNHRGETVRFYTDLIADRPVVINMMYVNCRGTCPETSSRLSAMWPDLEAAIGPSLRLISITLEPEVDTHEVLAEYAKSYRPRRAASLKSDWQFLSGAKESTEAIRNALGLTDPDPKIDQDVTQHATLLTFGNDRLDRWASLPVETSPKQMLKTIVRILRGAQPSGSQP